jgi:hypothetical protein
MAPDSLFSMFVDTLSQHIPPNTIWLPLAIAGAVALVGLLFAIKGAKLAPWLAIVVVGGLGGLAASSLAPLAGTPLWPSVAIGAVAGGALGFLLFRLLLAVLVGACFAVFALGIYSAQMLHDPLEAYKAQGLDLQQQLVSIPAPDAAIVQSSAAAYYGGLLTYLGQNVPNFHLSVIAIVLSTVIAGLVFGLLLPKLARAVWAASLGTLLLLVAAHAVVHVQWPEQAAWLSHWGPLIATAVWFTSIIVNYFDLHGFKLKQPAAPAPKPAAQH